MKSMSRVAVVKALRAAGCTIVAKDGPHDKWQCPCPQKHTANIPRHTGISPGVVRDTIKRMACMKKGWLQ